MTVKNSNYNTIDDTVSDGEKPSGKAQNIDDYSDQLIK